MIRHMKIGDVRSYERVITKDDVYQFGQLTGDMNDTHFNEDYAATTIFEKPIVHGMLVGSLFSKILV
jgi:3-hydroxybutyryl-CoA dehydratase